MKLPEKCPTCGGAVRISTEASDKRGFDHVTSFYIPVPASEAEALRQRARVTEAMLNEIMRTGTTQDGNTIEASLAYEALAYLAGERTIADLKRIKALPDSFEALGGGEGKVGTTVCGHGTPTDRRCAYCEVSP